MELDDLSLEHGTLTGEEGPRLCACGCGEPLKEDAKQAFIRGHKTRMLEAVPDDPEPGEEAKAKATIRVTARVKKEMQETISSYLSMIGGVWEMSDPICASELTERADKIAEKLTPVLARNQAFVRYFRSSSSFKESMDLFIVLAPLGKKIAQHHLFHTIGDREVSGPPVDYNAFVA